MNLNVASQHRGKLAFAAAAVPAHNDAIDIRHHVHFAFTFNVMVDVGVNAVFKIQAAPPSAGDPCVPGAFVDVPEVPLCDWLTAQPAATSDIMIPAGTKAGSMCTATLPCRPDAFLKVLPVSGDTGNVEVVATLSGPR